MRSLHFQIKENNSDGYDATVGSLKKEDQIHPPTHKMPGEIFCVWDIRNTILLTVTVGCLIILPQSPDKCNSQLSQFKMHILKQYYVLTLET